MTTRLVFGFVACKQVHTHLVSMATCHTRISLQLQLPAPSSLNNQAESKSKPDRNRKHNQRRPPSMTPTTPNPVTINLVKSFHSVPVSLFNTMYRHPFHTTAHQERSHTTYIAPHARLQPTEAEKLLDAAARVLYRVHLSTAAQRQSPPKYTCMVWYTSPTTRLAKPSRASTNPTAPVPVPPPPVCAASTRRAGLPKIQPMCALVRGHECPLA